MGSVLAQRVKDNPEDAAAWMGGLASREPAGQRGEHVCAADGRPGSAGRGGAWVDKIGNENTVNRDIESIARKWLGGSGGGAGWLAGTNFAG